jgi:hypothetical protein
MHLSASRSYDCPLRCGSILTVATGRMMLAISEGFAAETRSYADFTQSRSRKNLEASINGAAGVFLQVAVHASHGESGLAERPGFSQNTAKCISGPRMETSAPRADVFPEGPVPWPLFLTIIYFYQARQYSTVLPTSTTCFVITRKAKLHPLLRFGRLLVLSACSCSSLHVSNS